MDTGNRSPAPGRTKKISAPAKTHFRINEGRQARRGLPGCFCDPGSRKSISGAQSGPAADTGIFGRLYSGSSQVNPQEPEMETK